MVNTITKHIRFLVLCIMFVPGVLSAADLIGGMFRLTLAGALAANQVKQVVDSTGNVVAGATGSASTGLAAVLDTQRTRLMNDIQNLARTTTAGLSQAAQANINALNQVGQSNINALSSGLTANVNTLNTTMQAGITDGQSAAQNAINAGQSAARQVTQTAQAGISAGQNATQNVINAGQNAVQTGMAAGQNLGQNVLAAGQSAVQQVNQTAQAGISAGQNATQNVINAGQNAVQTGITAGQNLGQNALMAGQSAVQQVNQAAQAGISVGQNAVQNAIDVGQSAAQTGIAVGQNVTQQGVDLGQAMLATGTQLGSNGMTVGSTALNNGIKLAQAGVLGASAVGTAVLQQGLQGSAAALDGATVAAAVMFNPVTAELVWVAGQLLAGVMRDLFVAAGGPAYTMAKDMLKELAGSLTSVKDELLEAMRIDKFKKLTNIQFAAYLEDKKKTLEAAAKKIGDGTVDSVMRLLPELDKDYFALYLTDPIKEKIAQAKTFFTNGFTSLFKGVIQASTVAQLHKFMDVYQGFKGTVAGITNTVTGGVGSALQSTQDLAVAGTGLVSEIGSTFNQAVHDTNAAFAAEAGRTGVNPLTVPVVQVPAPVSVLPTAQQVVQVRDSESMGVQTRQQVDAQTGVTQTVVARR